jgi:uncharacterized protein YcbK (DUF882 family)
MKLTDNFYLQEFNCKDGTEIPLELIDNVQELACNLQILREYLGESIFINSAYRHREYNQSIGGSSRSQHLLAKASDIRLSSYNPIDVYNAIDILILRGDMKEGGLGLYNSFVHYDIRGTRARWDFRK